jgi:Asp-tRNA(Asn)/Glu-tRNA(Gln) amidotransferase A subunit family amidase
MSPPLEGSVSPGGSARSRLQTTLDRIDRIDGQLGAFTEVLGESAAADAARTDELAAGVRPDGATSPLWGLPIGVKELFEIAGGPASYGSEVLAGRRATHDSAVVARLRAAGAVIVGATRSHEFGWGITTQNKARGSTRNPWDLGRVPGGSSGGSAAAVAAGMVALATGTDTGGSIRIPAAFCGVLGLKTTVGRISRVGMAPLAPSFDTPGFLARSIDLLRAALAATAGPDAGDPATIGRPPVELRGPSLGADVGSALRFAVPAALLQAGPDDRWRPSLDAVVAGLRAIGGEQVEVEAPDASGLLDVFAPMQMAEALHVHEDVLGTFPAEADRYGADVRSRLEQARTVDIRRYLAAGRAANELRTAMLRIFAMAPLLVTPVGSCGPSTTADPDEIVVGRQTVPLRAAVMPSTVLQNLCGLPSLTVPVATDADGLPVGIQLTGGPWSEPHLLSIGAALEAAGTFTVHTPPRFAPDP